ncbi:MAG TPA: hypothetical protein VHU80_22410 [Polyangiaceae bacterium]|jgi:hypothetical protein|nr:hypothetical protein [Polyangiaceae bacterium]
MTDANMPWIVLGLVVAALIVVAAIVARRRAQSRSAELRRRFGPEYDRAVIEYGGAGRAERELAARTGRVERFHFRDLSEAERGKFGDAWTDLQARFVDDPEGAAAGADQLITEVMRARGYPIEDFEHQAADLSVDHADVVQHYRAAQSLTNSKSEGATHTEELRQAIVHYRALFADLLQGAQSAPHSLHEAHG